MSILNQTLIITAIGIGLIFFGIICLWIMMELMVRFIHDPREKEEAEAAEPEQIAASASDARRKAAAAAVAVALARSSANLGVSAHASQPVSSWQSVRRAMDRQQNSQLFIRK